MNEVVGTILGIVVGGAVGYALNTLAHSRNAARELIFDYFKNVYWKHARAVEILSDPKLMQDHPLMPDSHGKALNEIQSVSNWFEMMLHLSKPTEYLLQRETLERVGLVKIAAEYAGLLISKRYEIKDDWPELYSIRRMSDATG